TDIRRIIFDLMPYTMTDYGLVETLNTFIQNRKGVEFNLIIHEKAKIASSLIENNLFRIVQEIHSNIVKHSRAKHATLQLNIDKDRITLSVQDDGIGFDANKNNSGYGLVSIADRVELLNGTLEVESRPGEGTSIRVIVPNKEDYEKDIRNR
ncbi:MAG: ATP-binding protein, partial [Bacillota bacterium]|nr:ATP-binding protein [Bacillota bacterium]